MATSLTSRRRSYVAVTVTLTGGADRILDLVNAIMAAETQGDNTMLCPDACGHLSLQAAVGNASVVYVGDALVAATRAAVALYPPSATATDLETHVYRAPINAIQLGSLYALGTAGQKLNVEVMTF